MNYQIVGLCPRSDITMGAWGFGIHLFPGFKKAVSASGITKDKAYTAIENNGREWLEGCGFGKSRVIDYDGHAEMWRVLGIVQMERVLKEPLYKPNQDLRIQWGEWGPEHITVPGNACGLDIGHGIGGPPGGKTLSPHNIDSMSQAMLLLVVFTWFAESIGIGV